MALNIRSGTKGFAFGRDHLVFFLLSKAESWQKVGLSWDEFAENPGFLAQNLDKEDESVPAPEAPACSTLYSAFSKLVKLTMPWYQLRFSCCSHRQVFWPSKLAKKRENTTGGRLVGCTAQHASIVPFCSSGDPFFFLASGCPAAFLILLCLECTLFRVGLVAGCLFQVLRALAWKLRDGTEELEQQKFANEEPWLKL